MLGLEYYGAPNGWFWALAVIAAAALLSELPGRRPSRTDAVLAAVLAARRSSGCALALSADSPGARLGPVPFRAWGMRRDSSPRSDGAVRSSAILAAQAVALRGYALVTARCHDLPWPGRRNGVARRGSPASRRRPTGLSSPCSRLRGLAPPRRHLGAGVRSGHSRAGRGGRAGGDLGVGRPWFGRAPRSAPAGLAARLPWLPAACRKWLGSLARLVLVVLAWRWSGWCF